MSEQGNFFLDLQQTIEALELAIDGGGLESLEQAELVGRSAHHHLVELAAEVEFHRDNAEGFPSVREVWQRPNRPEEDS